MLIAVIANHTHDDPLESFKSLTPASKDTAIGRRVAVIARRKMSGDLS